MHRFRYLVHNFELNSEVETILQQEMGEDCLCYDDKNRNHWNKCIPNGQECNFVIDGSLNLKLFITNFVIHRDHKFEIN